jgi:hypothetical protein
VGEERYLVRLGWSSSYWLHFFDVNTEMGSEYVCVFVCNVYVWRTKSRSREEQPSVFLKSLNFLANT